MKYNKHILAFFLCYILSKNTSAQAGVSDTVTNIRHALILYKIQAAFNKLEYTSFKVKYTYKKSDKINKILDSSSAHYSMHAGMMKGNHGKTELLLNSDYYMMVDPEDSIITLSRAKGGGIMFQVDFFDSLFQRANIKGFEQRRENDSTSVLKILFKPHSYYKDYEITYNSNKNLITKILLEYPDDEYDENGNPPPANRRNMLELIYSNYRTENFDVGMFSEGRYVKKNENGKFIGIGKHSKFNVVSNDPDL